MEEKPIWYVESNDNVIKKLVAGKQHWLFNMRPWRDMRVNFIK